MESTWGRKKGDFTEGRTGGEKMQLHERKRELEGQNGSYKSFNTLFAQINVNVNRHVGGI